MTAILGSDGLAAADLVGWLEQSGYTPVAPWSGWADLVAVYAREAAAEGVAYSYAVMQMVHETRYLNFGGDVRPEQFNPAGLGATGAGAAGASFPDEQTGIRAQIQHLRRGGDPRCTDRSKLHNRCVDPRFDLVTPGSRPTWESLDGHWAVPGVGYGEGIVATRNQVARQGVPSVGIDSNGIITWGTVDPVAFPDPGGTAGGFSEPAWGMCCHTEVGSHAGTEQVFDHEQAGAFGQVDWDGSFEQFFPVGKGWMPWTQVAGNPNYRGIETVDGGDPNTPWTPQQIDTLGRLAAEFAALDGFPLELVDHGGHGITTHCHYPSGQADGSWGGHPCPGPVRVGQMPDVLAAARRWAGQPTPAPAPPPPTQNYPGDHMTRHPLTIATDPQGNGYADLAVDFTHIVSLFSNGADPQTGGHYTPIPRLSASQEGNGTRVELEGGPANGHVLVFVAEAV